jgi:hypothetical protein
MIVNFNRLIFFVLYIYHLELQTYEQQYEAIKIENEEEIARYYKLKKKLELVQDQMSAMINEPKYILPFLQPGRLVTVSFFFIKPIDRIQNFIFRLNPVILISIGVWFLISTENPVKKFVYSSRFVFNLFISFFSQFTSSMF